MDNKNQVMEPLIIMTRERSSMASTWEDHLCLCRIGDRWMLGEYGYNWAVSVYDLPENKLERENDELYIPEEWEGHKVLGISECEYIETDELVSNGNYVEFDSNSLDKAIQFAVDYEWVKYEGFHEAMDKLKFIVDTTDSKSPTTK